MMLTLLIIYIVLVAVLVAGLNRLERALRIPGYAHAGGQ